MVRSWYRRHFSVPNSWKDQRILLNFGAVDWQAQVFINGQEVGTHKGGYDKVFVIYFSFTSTPANLLTNWNTTVFSKTMAKSKRMVPHDFAVC